MVAEPLFRSPLRRNCRRRRARRRLWLFVVECWSSRFCRLLLRGGRVLIINGEGRLRFERYTVKSEHCNQPTISINLLNLCRIDPTTYYSLLRLIPGRRACITTSVIIKTFSSSSRRATSCRLTGIPSTMLASSVGLVCDSDSTDPDSQLLCTCLSISLSGRWSQYAASVFASASTPHGKEVAE